MNEAKLLQVTGRVEKTLELSFDELAGIPDGQVPDVSQLDTSRCGTAIRLDTLLALTRPTEDAQQLTIKSADGYTTSVPLDAMRERAVLIYALDGKQLPDNFGGPLRFFVPEAAACGVVTVDTCANVKRLTSLEVT